MSEPLRDPTSEVASTARARRPPLLDLEGRIVGLVDIGKMRGDEFIDRLERNLAERGVTTRRYRKPTNTRVAPVELIQRIASESHAVVLALSD